MDTNLTETRNKTLAIRDYFNDVDQRFLEKFLARKQTYRLNEEARNQLQKVAQDYAIIAFSAQWCKDCMTNIPVLYLLAEVTGIEVRIFAGIKKDPLSHTRKWRIPPSPREMETFKIEKIPTIIIFDNQGHEIGRIVENPKLAPTLEQEISMIIKSKQ